MSTCKSNTIHAFAEYYLYQIDFVIVYLL